MSAQVIPFADFRRTAQELNQVPVSAAQETVQETPSDSFNYQQMVEDAMRSIVIIALMKVVENGRGEHFFHIGFNPQMPGVVVPKHLKTTNNLVVILQHNFRDLEVDDSNVISFSVTLSFNGADTRITVPLSAINSFADPTEHFGFDLNANHVEIDEPSSGA